MILEALDNALFDDLMGAIDNRALREYLETDSLGQSTEICIKIYGEYCGRSAQWQLMAEDIASTLKFEFPLLSFALNMERSLMLPNLNPECKCCLRAFLAKVVQGMHGGLQVTQACDMRTHAVSVWNEIMHMMNDPQQDPLDVVLALIQKCKQDRDVASICDYLRSQTGKSTPQPVLLNQVLAAQQGVSGDDESEQRMCYRHHYGVHCKFGDKYKHIHAPKGSAARCA